MDECASNFALIDAGLRKATVSPVLIVAVIVVKYVILPAIGIGVVLTAAHLGFLPTDPLFRFVLMIQFTLPPAMNIGMSRSHFYQTYFRKLIIL